jgi:hypothetical protein
MLEAEWNDTLSKWAHAQDDIKALMQIGSRVQANATVDAWSDFDYQLITSRPDRYLDGAFARQISQCWVVGATRAFGNVTKISAVYEGALEVDFVILRHWEVAAATFALRWPRTERWWPGILRQGTEDLRRVAGRGWKMIKGGRDWENRYGRLKPFRAALTERAFDELCGEFWSHLIWAVKKAERGEYFAAQRAFHEVLQEKTLRLLEEEGLLDRKPADPLGRRAEQWLSQERLERARIPTHPDRASLFAAFHRIAALFTDVAEAVSRKNNWDLRPFAEVRAWLAKR